MDKTYSPAGAALDLTTNTDEPAKSFRGHGPVSMSADILGVPQPHAAVSIGGVSLEHTAFIGENLLGIEYDVMQVGFVAPAQEVHAGPGIAGQGNAMGRNSPEFIALQAELADLKWRHTEEIADLKWRHAEEVGSLQRQIEYYTGLLDARDIPAFDPVATSMARGASYMKEEFDKPDNLTLADASAYAGRSDRVINQERNRGWLYALILEGNTRGYRYPKWQFDVAAARLRPVLDILLSSGIGCWAMHNFLTTPHGSLDDRSPGAAIADAGFPLERIVNVAHARVDPHQGAA